MNFHAHSLENQPPENWEPLFFADCPALGGRHCDLCESLDPQHGHLNKVAWWSGKFAREMFPEDSTEAGTAREWGYLAGLWHDLGKFAPEWQTYLASKTDTHVGDAIGTIDHSTAGAVFAHAKTPFGDLLSYMIAGHHAGLADGSYLFPDRLKKNINKWRPYAEAAGVPLDRTIPTPPLTRPDAGNDGMAFMLRFFFSCLVDADYLATESFMAPEKSELRQSWPEDLIDRMINALEKYTASHFGPAGADPVNQARASVRDACLAAADCATGFFSLTVPTGGGKTLSSLLFALRHAKKNGLRRAVFVIPFTTIIKQNADIFRDVFAGLSNELGREIVLEHHSKFDPAKETDHNRLASENWDAPLVVTTNVQFFESLFANRTSACRKLHRIARSVVVFDEVQALPSQLLHPILRGLRGLVHDLHATAVLCTATQPALEKREGFFIGVPKEEITPIIKNEPALFRILERVTCRNLGPLDDEALVAHILKNAAAGCLLVLNTTKSAQILHQKLGAHTRTLHLSARMCPAHVIATLEAAKCLRKAGYPVVLVSTQLIEAGVDISFPTVYRAECGLDSFAQAAGRCNRNGELRDANGERIKGSVFFFQPSEHPIPKGLADLTTAAAITRASILPNFAESRLLDPSAVRSYFEHAIWQAGPKTDQWDEPHLVSGGVPCFAPHDSSASWSQAYQFKTAAEKFRLIDSKTHSVLIPWGDEGKKLVEEIRSLHRQKRPPNRFLHRRAQQFTVSVYDGEWQHLKPSLSLCCEEAFAILDHPENSYPSQTGLKRPEVPDDPAAFCS